MNKTFLLFALFPLFALAADVPTERQLPIKRIDKKDIPLDELAHMFFVSRSSRDLLPTIISPEGLERVKPELTAHNLAMSDEGQRAARLRQNCGALRKASTATEFAAVLSKSDEEEHDRMQKAARSILSVLDSEDRKALEHFLDTQFRLGVAKATMDWVALFASPTEPFPSEHTIAVTERACDFATKAEVETRHMRAEKPSFLLRGCHAPSAHTRPTALALNAIRA